VDRVTRKELKRDKFALEVQHGLEYVTGHRRIMLRWGAIGAAVVLLVVVFFFYSRHQAGIRQQAIEGAMRIENATIGAPQTEYVIAYPTDGERNKAAVKTWSEIASKYSGTNEGIVAEYFLGSHAAEDGNIQAAQKHFQTVLDSGNADYGSLAKLAMSQLYAAQGKLADGEKLIKSVIDHPTVLVSKEAATIALAHLIAPTDPGRARKMLEPMRGNERTQVSQQVLRALGDLPK
jgi:predicted negative regulator of RcsB-dependent stress response